MAIVQHKIPFAMRALHIAGLLLAAAGIMTLFITHSVDSPVIWVGPIMLATLAVAFGLYLAAFVITMAVHEPLNGVLRAAGDPEAIANLAAVRDAFHETRWVAWHLVRTIVTTPAFGALAWALVRHGRASAHAADPQAHRPARTTPTSPAGATP